MLLALGTKQVIGIPAPAWSEFLCGADGAAFEMSKNIQGHSSVKILPFDAVAASEAALLHRDILEKSGNKKGASSAPWQKIKIDRQVLAIARMHNVSCIYTGDENMIAEAALLNIPTQKIEDIPLSPAQSPLF